MEAASGLDGNLEIQSVSRRGNVTRIEGRFRRAGDPSNLLPLAAAFTLEADFDGGDAATLNLRLSRDARNLPFYITPAGAEVRTLTFEGYGEIEG